MLLPEKKKKLSAVLNTAILLFFKLKTPTIQQWSTNKLSIIVFSLTTVQLRTVAPFSLQDTEYICFKQLNTVAIQRQNRKKN